MQLLPNDTRDGSAAVRVDKVFAEAAERRLFSSVTKATTQRVWRPACAGKNFGKSLVATFSRPPEWLSRRIRCTMPPVTRHVFPDTNLFLHYKPLEQIDWTTLVGSNAVVLVVTPVVLGELDKHKFSHPHARIRDRAAAATKRLVGLLRSDSPRVLRQGVTIEFVDHEPNVDFAAVRLSPSSQDDQLLASMLTLRAERADADIVVATGDTGLLLKAHTRGIGVVELPDALRLPLEPDPAQLEVRELRRKVAELESRSPTLSLIHRGGGAYRQVTLTPCPPLTGDDLARRMEAIRERYPTWTTRADGGISPRGRPGRAQDRVRMAALMAGGLSDSDVRDYNEKLGAFYAKYEEHQRAERAYRDRCQRTVELTLDLINTGSAPAKDVDVFLRLARGPFSVEDESFIPRLAPPPTPPEGPLTTMERLARMYNSPSPLIGDLSALSGLNYRDVRSNVSALSVREEDGWSGHVNVRTIKHNMPEVLPPLVIVFETCEAARSLAINYRINSASTPRDATGQLHLVIEPGASGSSS